MEWIPRSSACTKGGTDASRGEISIHPKINWGRGRLLPYESLTAFVAKFCALNDISGKACRDFFGQQTGQYDWWYAGFCGPSIQSMASILDEPVSVVKLLGKDEFVLPACFGTFSFAHQKERRIDAVTFCPVCKTLGYHAVFHTNSLFKKCPIHFVDLMQMTTTGFGGAAFDSYAKGLIGVFDDDGTGRWLSACHISEVEELVTAPGFRAIVEWFRSIRSFTERASSINVVSLPDGGGYVSQDIGVLLGRLDWAVPMPNGLKEALRSPPLCLKPVQTPCGINAVRQLRQLLTALPSSFENFAAFLRCTTVLNRETSPSTELVSDVVRSLRRHEIRRKCSWGWLRRVGWVIVDRDGWPYWQVTKANEYLTERIRSKWLDFLGRVKPQRTSLDDWFRYCKWANLYVERGIAIPLREGQRTDGDLGLTLRPQPMIQFNMDSEIKKLLEFVLHFEALADVEDTYDWIDSISRHLPPYRFPVRTPSSGNLFLDRGTAYILRWPRVRRTYAEHEEVEQEPDFLNLL